MPLWQLPFDRYGNSVIVVRTKTMNTAAWRLAILIAGITLASCSQTSGPPKKVCYPVKGELTVKGQPAAGALVIFQPPGANSAEWSAGYPRATVAADGTFEVGTYADNDGAPAGDYNLAITWMIPNPQDEEAAGTDRLQGRYADAATSKLTIKVEAAATQLAPIRLP
jgi:hypothetical protein